MSNSLYSSLLQLALSISLFIYGSILLSDGMICDNLQHTGLYVWFIITYVLYTISALTFTCMAVMMVMVILATADEKTTEGDGSGADEKTPLTTNKLEDTSSEVV